MKFFNKVPLAILFLSFSIGTFAQNVSTKANYKATVIKSVNEVNRIFQNLRSDDRPKSQCFYRAHTWCNDMEKSEGVKSAKIFIFYSPRFKKEVTKKWWFHVAPLVFSKKDDEGNIQEYVMDKTFNGQINGKDEPVTVKDWINHFSHGKKCVDISSYQQYEDDIKKPRDQQAYCYIRKTPMYAFSPDDISKNDCANPPVQRTEWDQGEVSSAQLAFGKKSLTYFFHRLGL